MKRVGLGIAKDAEGYLFVTQNFADNPLSAKDLLELESELLAAINTKRASFSLPSLSLSLTLQNVARSWSQRMAREGFFAIRTPGGDQLIELIRQEGVNTAIQSHILEVSQKSQLRDEVTNQSGAKSEGNRNVGIGLAVNSLGDILATVVYTP
jgi:uncharacterized protein YkwD